MTLYIQLFRNIVGFLGWRLAALLVLMVSVGLTEGLSITLLLPLLSHIGISYTAGQGAASEMLNRGLSALEVSFGPLGLLFIVIGVVAVQAVLSVALQWCMVRATHGYQRRQQLQLFDAFMSAQWEFVIERKAGELTNAIVTECDRVAQAFHVGLYLISTAIITCIYLAFALVIAWPITMGLIAGALLMALMVLPLYRKGYAVGRTIAPLNAELQSVLGERISNIKVVKATVSEHIATAHVGRIVGKLERAKAQANFLPRLVRGLFEFLAFVTLAMVFVFGQKGFGIAPGNVIVIFALFVRLFPRITTLQGYLHMLNSYLPAVHAISALQADAEARSERTDDFPKRLSVLLPAHLALHDVDVYFGEHKVLDQINLTIPLPGLLAIVGSSGAGKSTLVHALLGLVEPTRGSIRLGQHELRSLPLRAWRRAMGYVPQETILFHASIRENLTLAKPDATEAEIQLAAKRAHAQDFIDALPRGYDSVIGDQGVKLSGGQRQRLGIARALLANPVLLLLDEPMSAVDAETEGELLRTLEELRRDVGILIVAHRLAAARAADCICVIEGGRVAEVGTWNDLMARKARLYALAKAQALADDYLIAAL